MGWAAAVVLGAILAPPDPVTATTVASKTGLSHRLVVILEGHAEHGPALLQALDAQRGVVHRLRDGGRMGSALAERLDTELDLDAMTAAGDGARLTDGGKE